VSLPLTMGHGDRREVLALGPDAQKENKGGIKVGDVALVYPWIGCANARSVSPRRKHVPEARSLGVYCDGGYADHIRYRIRLSARPQGARSGHAAPMPVPASPLTAR